MFVPTISLDSGALTAPQIVSVRVAAAAVGVHPNTLRNAVARGHLNAHRYGARCVRYDLADVYALFTPYVGGEFGLCQTAR